MPHLTPLIPLLLWTLCSTATAVELPARPTLERPLPLGQTVTLDGDEHKCFTVAEWRAVGAIIIDYRALLSWALMADGVLIDRTLARDARALEAAELRRALLAAQADYALRIEGLDDALAASERRRKMQAWGFSGLAVLGLATALTATLAR